MRGRLLGRRRRRRRRHGVRELECPLEPKLHMDCDAETCQCFEDGLPTGSCAAEGACLDIDTLADKMSACCGFPDLP